MPLTILQGPDEVPIAPLLGRTVSIIGFGNQGSVHAANLRDSGIRVIVGARPDGESYERAKAAGFDTRPIGDATQPADLIVLALPDEAHAEVLDGTIKANVKPGSTIGFLHGFSVAFNRVAIPQSLGVVLVAPKGPGPTLRMRFQHGQGIPCLFAVHQESLNKDARSLGLAWAHGIGCHRAGILCTSFRDEAETDLFGEQAVLCGGMTALILAAFETLVEAGYPSELAYLECCHEVKQIADLVYQRGIAGMMQAISNTAEFGAHVSGTRLIDDAFRMKLRELLIDIQNDRFASALAADHAAGFPWFMAQRQKLSQHDIEAAGQRIRLLMPWLNHAEE